MKDSLYATTEEGLSAAHAIGYSDAIGGRPSTVLFTRPALCSSYDRGYEAGHDEREAAEKELAEMDTAIEGIIRSLFAGRDPFEPIEEEA